MTEPRERLDFDVVIVGAGPAGLSAACKLKQLAQKKQMDISVCILEKASEIGSHILSGAVLDPQALLELFPNAKEKGVPLNTVVNQDDTYFLSKKGAIKFPYFLVPKTLHNQGNYIISLANVCRWLAEQAEELEVELLPGFAAQQIIYENDRVIGVQTSDMGVDKNGNPKDTYQQGYDICGKFVMFAEGCRGHLGKKLLEKYDLQKESDPQHFGIGFKEIWEIDPKLHSQGRVIHTLGYPLDTHTEGGGFLYHMENNQISMGLIVALNYTNPYLNPYEEFNKWKQHSMLSKFLKGAKRIAYGARAVHKGGLFSLPKLEFPGGMLIGCDAGFLNPAKIKGSHTAMKSGMLAAESIIEALSTNSDTTDFEVNFKKSSLYNELYVARNFHGSLNKYGVIMGGGVAWLEQNILDGKAPWNIHNNKPDYQSLIPAVKAKKIEYPKADGKISFDKMASVSLVAINHDQDQPVHLKLINKNIPIEKNLPDFAEPAQRYCPAGVYEIITKDDKPYFQINAQNCIHCKTCDIKDPAQNINWVAPEGGSGPNYPNM